MQKPLLDASPSQPAAGGRTRLALGILALLIFFGTLLGNLLPSLNAQVSWQSHVCGFAAGILVGWLLHPRRAARPRRAVG